MKIRNKVQLIGNLGNDPQITKLENGNSLAKFSVATNESYLNKAGERIENTQWHNIIAWGKTAEIVEKILKKGNEVVVEGKLINRSYEDDNGVKKYITEIQANELLKISAKE
ncbi:MAG: single-stranded DNA-binding protein [Flavobacteriales bacterium]|jgi:single-strand DNA-binding protein|nr:single-stranded DNA-binding protein [Flavobacteriales bacterium]